MNTVPHARLVGFWLWLGAINVPNTFAKLFNLCEHSFFSSYHKVIKRMGLQRSDMPNVNGAGPLHFEEVWNVGESFELRAPAKGIKQNHNQ